MRATVGAGHDVVDVEVEGVTATRDLTAVLVALEHAAADGGWNGRARANECYR